MTFPFIGSEFKIPEGVIIPWYGNRSEVPPGWLWCDGNNGTPELSTSSNFRHVKCVPDSSTDPGATGGNQSSVSVSESQIPSHTHGGTTSTDGDHYHQINTDELMADDPDRDPHGWEDPNTTDNSVTTSTEPDHTHNVTTENVGSTGASLPTQPRGVAVGFVQKA